MKLVNPAGRNVSSFDTQADYCRCICSTWDLHSGTYSYSYNYGWCACECSYGSDNANANHTISYNSN